MKLYGIMNPTGEKPGYLPILLKPMNLELRNKHYSW